MKNESNTKHHSHQDSIDATSEELANNIQNENENLIKDKDIKKGTKDLKNDADQLAGQAQKRMIRISEKELNQLKDELAEAKDLGLRSLAELENFRSRSNRVLQEERKYASMNLARAILPVWDNMGRALKAAENDLKPETIIDGLKMMYSDFLNILQKHNIEKIEALHEPFDPNYHESIAMMPDAEHPANTVIAETQVGFKLHDRVVRPSQVVLAAPVPVPNTVDQKPSADLVSEE